MESKDFLSKESLPLKYRISIGDVYRVLRYEGPLKNPDREIELVLWED